MMADPLTPAESVEDWNKDAECSMSNTGATGPIPNPPLSCVGLVSI